MVKDGRDSRPGRDPGRGTGGSAGTPGRGADPSAPTVLPTELRPASDTEPPVDPEAPTVLDGSPRRADRSESPSSASRPADGSEEIPTLSTGTVLFGEYEIEGLLGAGGMGAVYRARHRSLGEARAIKVLQPSFGADRSAATKLFDREAKALLKLQHPAVVRCHDLLSDDHGRVYLVMELVEGTPLSDLLKNGPLPPQQVIALGRRLAAGLASAHRQGIVHRDLAPDNVVLPDGRPDAAKLIDFGIAKEFESSATTVLEGFKGKLRYASPEQMGFFDGKIDGRSDYYSLGLTLYMAATGQPLEMGRTFAEAVDARRDFGGLPRGLPRSIRELVEPLLAFDPADRPESIEEHFGIVSGESKATTDAADSGGSWGWIVGGAGALAAAGVIAWLVVGPGAMPSPTEGGAAGGDAGARGANTDAARPSETATARDGGAGGARGVAGNTPREPSARERAALLRRQLQVESLLRSGDQALRENRLTRPLGDSALDKYRRVLEIDSDNEAALAGLDAISGRLLDMAGRALARGQVDRAQDYYEKAEATTPSHPRLAATRSAIEKARGTP